VKRKVWQRAELWFLEAHWRRLGTSGVAQWLNRQYGDVYRMARKLGCAEKAKAAERPATKRRKPRRRFWTDEELAFLRENYAAMSREQLGAKLGRSLSSVSQAAAKQRLTRLLCPKQGFDDFIREKHARQWSDSEIAAGWSAKFPGRQRINRRTVGDHRARMGLAAHHVATTRYRLRVAAKTREQCEKAGLASLALVRRRAFEQYAIDNGWPAELRRPRQVQIMNCLYELGPQTRRQIAARIGMPWKGKKTMYGNDVGGSYLAYLMRLGLVVKQKKVARDPDGTRVDLYSIPVHVVRGPVKQGESRGCG
jgi:hypothetical protein